MSSDNQYSLKEAMIFSQRIAQLTKALWKVIETDWQGRVKPFNLNINEHHILLLAYQMEGASVSDIAKYGVMHVSTAFNFSKKLEERGLIQFSKGDNDKRNTYIALTEKGKQLLAETMKAYEPNRDTVHIGTLPMKELFGRYPEFEEMRAIIRNVYGDDFVTKSEFTSKSILDIFTEEKTEDINHKSVMTTSTIHEEKPEREELNLYK